MKNKKINKKMPFGVDMKLEKEAIKLNKAIEGAFDKSGNWFTIGQINEHSDKMNQFLFGRKIKWMIKEEVNITLNS